MASWTTSKIFANLIGNAQILSRRTISSCFREITATPTRKLTQPATNNGVIFNQTRAASNGSKALHNYFSKEVDYQRNSLNCKSMELPTFIGFKDFELKIDEYGDASFTRTHKGQTVTVWVNVDIDTVDVDWCSEEVTSSDETSDSSDDETQLAETEIDDHDEIDDQDEVDDELDDELDDGEYSEEEPLSQIFHVSVTSNKKAAEEVTFICEFTVDTVYDDMYEEDIYDIVRVGIGKDGVTINELSTKKMPNDLFEIYYDYLKERGITQEFLNFLRNNFLPTYLHYCFVEHFLKPMKDFTK